MKVTRKVVGLDSNNQWLPNEVLCEQCETIIVEHEGIKLELRTIQGHAKIVVVTPDEDNGMRNTYIVPHTNFSIQQNYVKDTE